AFVVADTLAPIAVDVPVDAVGPIALFIEQAASKPEVEWGDQLDWTIRVANRSDSTLDQVQLDEHLPFGFAYVRGSAVLVNASGGSGALTDPPGAGPALSFALGLLGPHETATVRLATRVQAGAPTGEAQAVAEAVGHTASPGTETRSNAAPARTRVRGDAFADEGGIVGTVALDVSGGAAAAGPEPGREA